MRAVFLAGMFLLASATSGAPEGYAAHFSRGECLLRLKEFAEAEKQFTEALAKFPEHAADISRFRDLARNKVSNF